MPAGLLRLRKPSVVIRKFGNGFCNGCNGCQEEGRRKREECNGQCMGFNLYKEAGKRKMKSFEIALFGNAKANVTHNATAVFS
jgi:hypothetical protein